MFGIGMTELMVILVIGLVVLGPRRLPEMARSLGRALGEFRRASADLRQHLSDPLEEPKIKPPPSSESSSEAPTKSEAPEKPGTRETGGG